MQCRGALLDRFVPIFHSPAQFEPVDEGAFGQDCTHNGETTRLTRQPSN